MNQRNEWVFARRLLASALLVGTGLLGALAAPALAADPWSGAATLGVQIRGSRGPVVGARVEISTLRTDRRQGPEARATDNNGQSNFVGIAPGRWSLEIKHPEYLVFVASLNVQVGKKPEVVAQFLEASGPGRGTFKVKFLKDDRPLGEVIPGTATDMTHSDRSPPPGPAKEPAGSKLDPSPSKEAPPPSPASPPRRQTTDPPSRVSTPPAPEPLPQEAPGDDTASEAVEAQAPSTEPPAQPPTPPASPETPERELTPTRSAAPAPAKEPPPQRQAPVEAPVEPPKEPASEPGSAATPVTAAKEDSTASAPIPTDPVPPDPAISAPVATPTAIPAPTPVPAPETTAPVEEPQKALTSFRDRTCFECKPGEWAVSTEVTVPAGKPCRTTAAVAIRRAMQDVAASASEELGDFAGPMPLGLGDLPLSGASAAARNTLAPYLTPDASCRFLAVVIPRGGRFVGFRFAARDSRARGDCTGDEECEIGSARFLFSPVVASGDGASIVYTVFENTGDVPRSARMTGFFLAAAGWMEP